MGGDVNSLLAAQRVIALIERNRIDVSTEAAAHRAIADVLKADGLDAETEVRLSSKDRIDVLAGTVGIEVKVQGRRREIAKQLQRYAEHDQIEALVLATAGPWPTQRATLNGKPVMLASLTKGWL